MEHTDEKKIWGMHTLNDLLFLEKRRLAMGWKEMGDLSLLPANREAFKQKYAQVYPDSTRQSVANSAGMLYRFVHEANVGDYVIYPSRINREVNIGLISSGYLYDAKQADYVQQRRVKWLKHFPRTAFSQGALAEIGSAMTFFQVKNYAEEFLAALDSSFKPKEAVLDEDETVARAAGDIIEGTKDFILKELSRHCKGYALEGFAADLLRAMGYRTEISPRGGDSGIDICAYKDELPPRIVVQVKSQDTNIREQALQSLKGAMREGDYGLFITLSDYTQNARNYLENTPIIRGINGSELAELVMKYYDSLSDSYKRIVPLKKVYIPTAGE